LEENKVWRNQSSRSAARYRGHARTGTAQVGLFAKSLIAKCTLVCDKRESIAESGVQSADDVRGKPPRLFVTAMMAEANRALRNFVSKCLLPSARREVNQRACEMLRRVFEDVPCRFPTDWAKRDATSREGGAAIAKL